MTFGFRSALPAIAAALVCAPLSLPAWASNSAYVHRHYFSSPPPYPYYYNQQPITFRQYLAGHPKIRSATVGAGVGTAAGALTGLVTGRGVLHGAAVGAGTGAGVGLIRSSYIMMRHPILRDVATGGLAGAGLGWAGGRQGGTTARAAGVGAAIGLGVGMLKHM